MMSIYRSRCVECAGLGLGGDGFDGQMDGWMNR